jgi:hypothetical protein
MLALFDRVVLTQDVPNMGLQKSTVGTVMEVHTVPREGYEVEFFDDKGYTITWGSVEPDKLALLASRS